MLYDWHTYYILSKWYFIVDIGLVHKNYSKAPYCIYIVDFLDVRTKPWRLSTSILFLLAPSHSFNYQEFIKTYPDIKGCIILPSSWNLLILLSTFLSVSLIESLIEMFNREEQRENQERYTYLSPNFRNHHLSVTLLYFIQPLFFNGIQRILWDFHKTLEMVHTSLRVILSKKEMKSIQWTCSLWICVGFWWSQLSFLGAHKPLLYNMI